MSNELIRITREDLATTVSSTSPYVGQSAGDIFRRAFNNAPTIQGNTVQFLTGVIGSGVISNLNYTADVRPAGAGWNPTGDVDFKEVEVSLKRMQMQHQIAKEQFYNTFANSDSGFASATTQIPSVIQGALLEDVSKNLTEIIEDIIWNGRTNAPAITGLSDLIVNDDGVIGLYDGEITISNVVDVLHSVYNSVPEEIVNDPDLVFMTSPKVERLFKQAQVTQGLNTVVGAKELDYIGFKLNTSPKLLGDVIYVYRRKNLCVLTGLQADFQNVRLSDDSDRLDGYIRTDSIFALGLGIQDASEIVAYDVAFQSVT